MFRFLKLSLVVLLTVRAAIAQDYSNRGLMELKEISENKRMAWVAAYEDAVQTKTFSALPPIRQDDERFLDKNVSALRRMYAAGDARGLLNSVANYLQIQRQFVKDVMIPAEALTPANTEGIQKVYDKISAFAEKEKTFLVDINNALLLEPDDAPQTQPSQNDTADEEDEEMEEMRGSVVEERRKKSRTKLPHEQSKREKKKSKTGDTTD
jgi:hypothetical protein